MTTVTKKIPKLKPMLVGLAGLALFSLVGCSNTAKKEAFYNSLEAEQIFDEGVRHLRKKDYKAAVEDFEALEARYPFGEYGDKAQLGTLYAHLKGREYASVLAGGERFQRVYPTHDHLDYVLYLKGLASVEDLHGAMSWLPMERDERDMEDTHVALSDFSRLIKRYPESIYAKDAAQYVIYLRNLLAQHEIIAADYYYRRGAYLAAANRASEIVNTYDQSPVVIDALILMVKSYRKLELHDLANNAYQVLQSNFPNDPALAELG
ncbi:MAG: outer membrane protein assembly factor BamD [Gammaproteobacteria bacterium]